MGTAQSNVAPGTIILNLVPRALFPGDEVVNIPGLRFSHFVIVTIN